MRVAGTAKGFHLLRGFGVIGREQGETAYPARHSVIRGTMYHGLAAGDPVEFNLSQGGASAAARDVIRLACSLVPATLKAE